jgi:hypothetical protein
VPQFEILGFWKSARRPHEFLFGLRDSEFRILCEGEVSETKASRNFHIGICVGAVVGLAGVFATTGLDVFLVEGKGIFVLVLFIIARTKNHENSCGHALPS